MLAMFAILSLLSVEMLERSSLVLRHVLAKFEM